ncbi:MAG TPA: inorganic diphosphatase [Gemmatimonadaceae bacterium]|nr:inorganic diphosphatase [Gemmatimonadaceae bacterium]
MINPWHDLAVGKDTPREVSAVIEIPNGSRNKYELDKETGVFSLDRVLYSAVHYPGDYGFIPRTLAEDGDPCDVLVLIKEPTFPGCRIDVRPIGVLDMLDRGEPDAKILAVPAEDPTQNEFFDLADIPPHTLREIAHFFEIYKDLEGKRVQVQGWRGCDAAFQEILRSVDRYAARYPINPTTLPVSAGRG